eukprot:3375531-Pyramimonas_sp.AAC.1
MNRQDDRAETCHAPQMLDAERGPPGKAQPKVSAQLATPRVAAVVAEQRGSLPAHRMFEALWHGFFRYHAGRLILPHQCTMSAAPRTLSTCFAQV